ncbi:hypothetical protein KIPB_010240 [Kipferlia bialata]|uniref:Uncharacterized protein n=1 Tax=Kipferlia bialata TaxID=797122 RepID=A0A9K3D500_9EUKA|nr:hypothetical protein KIPB_010240 [Kipferlia bialata]|eukprot:g10240.t1
MADVINDPEETVLTDEAIFGCGDTDLMQKLMLGDGRSMSDIEDAASLTLNMLLRNKITTACDALGYKVSDIMAYGRRAVGESRGGNPPYGPPALTQQQLSMIDEVKTLNCVLSYALLIQPTSPRSFSEVV